MRDADYKMIKKLGLETTKSFFSGNEGDALNNIIAATGIALKVLGEKTGIFSDNQFTDIGGNYSKEDIQIL